MIQCCCKWLSSAISSTYVVNNCVFYEFACDRHGVDLNLENSIRSSEFRKQCVFAAFETASRVKLYSPRSCEIRLRAT